MLTLFFRHADGRVETHLAETGQSLLDAARAADIADIGGFCGGICACVQCIVRIDGGWIDAVGPPGDTERGMLNIGGDPGAGARLSCQIPLTPELSGLIVDVPPPWT